MWSRKTYQAVADVLSHAVLKTSKRTHLIEEFSLLFEQDNPHFDRTRFTAACQPPPFPTFTVSLTCHVQETNHA